MVLFFLFSQKIGSKSQFFVKKDGFFRPAGGDIPRQNPGSPAACQHGPFRGFRSFRVFRGPNAHRVTPINDRTYAVSVQTGRFTH
jgi:hypothetical protein